MECKKAKIKLCTRLGLAVLFLPLHGYAHECFQLMNQLCRDSRELWNSDQINFLKLLKKAKKCINWKPETIGETSREVLLQIQLFKVEVFLRSKEHYSNFLLFLSADYHIEFWYLAVTFFDHEEIEIYRKIIETIGSRVACIEGMGTSWDENDDSLRMELGKPDSDKIPFGGYISEYMIAEGEVVASSYYSGIALAEVFEYCLKNNITVYQWTCDDSESQLVDISQYLHHSELFSSVKRMKINEELLIGDDSLKILSTMLDSYPNIGKLRILMQGGNFALDRVMRYTDLAVYSLELFVQLPFSCSFKSYCPVALFKSKTEKKLMKFKWMEASYELDSTNIRGSVLAIKKFKRLELTGGTKLAASTMYDDELETFKGESMIMDTKYIYQCGFYCKKNKEVQLCSTLFKLLQPHVKVGLEIEAKESLTECEWLAELVTHPPPLLYKLRLDFAKFECDHMKKLLVACKQVEFQIADRGQIQLLAKAKYKQHYKDEKLALKSKKKHPVAKKSGGEERLEQEEAKMVGKHTKPKK